MILELDCGNSFIKWRLIASDTRERLYAGIADTDVQLFMHLEALADLHIHYCRLVSVRSDAESDALVAALRQRFSVPVACAQPAEQLAGVVNGYANYAQLGLDRWLALLGAYQISQGACLVIDVGTAVTADLVAVDGRHLGGFICPGLPLMRDLLKTHTRRIRYDQGAALAALATLEPGCSTAEAVERGCLLMLRGFVQTQYSEALARFPEGVRVFLTGGDVELVKDIVPEAQVVPDLVFVGLAIACPLA